MNPIPADLQQNIAVTSELTILHNYWAILYFIGLIVSIGWSFFRPSRVATLAFVGFGLLLFSFEYTKHILEPLKEQTLNSVITMQEHHQARRILNLSMIKLIPKGSLIIGWLMVLSSVGLILKKHFYKHLETHKH